MWSVLLLTMLGPLRSAESQASVAGVGAWLRERTLPSGVAYWSVQRTDGARGRITGYLSDDGRWRLSTEGVVEPSGLVVPDPGWCDSPDAPSDLSAAELPQLVAWVAGHSNPKTVDWERTTPGLVAQRALPGYLRARWLQVLTTFARGDDALTLARLRRLEEDWAEIRLRFGRGWYTWRELPGLANELGPEMAVLRAALEHPMDPATIPEAVRDLDRVTGREESDIYAHPIYRRILAQGEAAVPALRWAVANDRRLVRAVFADSKGFVRLDLVRVADVARAALARKTRPGIRLIS